MIALGALGSAAWEFILKPSSGMVMGWILSIGTLGIDSFRDSVYTEIADGHHEASAMGVYNMMTSVFAAICLIIAHKAFRKLRGITAKKGRPPTRRGILWFALFYTIVFTVFVVIQQTRRSYANSAVTHFEKMLTITRPSFSDAEYQQIQSEFALVSKREEFVKLIEMLQERSVKLYPERKIPTFEAW